MSDQQLSDASTMTVGGESSEAVVEVNIKTLDSQIFSFQVNKNMLVSEFKAKIASEVGLPVEQQRLIFRGKVLKDEHTLSEYHVDSGHTLHLVARQPSESQAPSGTSPGEASSNNGEDPNATGRPNRIGQISHSVVLGTLNGGDQGEGFVPDISQVIGAVLNSIGLGGQNATSAIGAANVMGGPQPSMQFNVPVQVSQGNQMDGTPSNTGTQGQAGTQAHPGQAFPSQSFPQAMHIPMGAAMQIPMGVSTPFPSVNVPISDSLHTLSEFMSNMELALSQNGSQPNESQTNTGDQPALDLPSNARGLPTPEALMTVLSQAQRLLDDHTIAALSHISERLEQEGSSNDITVRGQIQRETMQLGIAMQHMGALFLELGRTILTLRMGQSPADAYVNAGPAVYISSSGPNPIMVQPFPLQTSSLFGGTTAASNSANIGPLGIGTAPRHVNIHIHTAVGPRGVPNGAGTQGGQSSRAGSGTSGHSRVGHSRNVNANVVPSRPSVTVPGASQTGVPVSQLPVGYDQTSTMVAEINSLARNLSASQTGVPVSQPPAASDQISRMVAEINARLGELNMQTGNQAPSDGQVVSSAIQDPSSGSGASNNEANNQLGDLADPGAKELKSSFLGNKLDAQEQKESVEFSQSNSNDISLMDSKEVLPSSSDGGCNDLQNGEAALKLVSDNSERTTAVPLGLGLGGLHPKRKIRQPKMHGKASDITTSNASDQNQQKVTNDQQLMQSLASTTTQSDTSNVPFLEGQMRGQGDVANAMTEVLHSPAFSGILSNVSQQAGVGSPNVLRNMLEQFTRNPAMMNTVNQIAQQFDGQDVGNIMSGMGQGRGGGFDLAGMVQQMMPVVSQALGGGNIPLQQPLSNIRNSSRDDKASDKDSQIDLQPVLQRIENHSPPQEIFRSLVTIAARLNDVDSDDLLNELCSEEEGLASEFMEVLRRDLHGRLQGDKEHSDMS